MVEGSGHQPLALVPNVSYLSFQLYAWSPITKKESPDTKFLIAIGSTFAWLRSRFRDISDMPENIIMSESPDIEMLKSFQIDSGYYLSVSFSRENRKWALRLIEPDMGPNPGMTYNRPPVAGRMFQTDIAFSIIGDRVECGFRTYCIQPKDCKIMDWEVFRLKVVKMLIGSIGLKQIKPLKMEPYRDLAIGSILNLINKRERQMPLILVTEEVIKTGLQRGVPPSLDELTAILKPYGQIDQHILRISEDEKENKEYIDVNSIAARAVGFAHTIYIKTKYINELSQRIGIKLNSDGGEIAVIMPVFSSPENDWLFTSAEIRAHGKDLGEQGETLTGYVAFEQAFITKLSKLTKQNSCIKYGSLLFLNEIRLLESQHQAVDGNDKARIYELEKEVCEKGQIITDLQRKNGGLESTWAELSGKNIRDEHSFL